MAKTITRLEPGDIDTKNNPLHKDLAAGLVVNALVLTSPAREGETVEQRTERVLTGSVMTFLNYLNDIGYTITKQEDIPSAFTRGE